MSSPRWVRDGALVLVCVSWAASIAADIMNPVYEPPAMLAPIMMAVAGYLFAARKPDEKEVDAPQPSVPDSSKGEKPEGKQP